MELRASRAEVSPHLPLHRVAAMFLQGDRGTEQGVERVSAQGERVSMARDC